ncbi:hypothetical protein ACFL9U_07435 [Thermodesulfobacteriota bacterium]
MKNYHSFFIFATIIVVLLASLGLSLSKFSVAKKVGYQFTIKTALESDGITSNGFVILYPDEIKYLSWLVYREDSFRTFIEGEGDLTVNVFGYLVSGLYLLFNFNWQYVFIIGIVGYIFLFISFNNLLLTLGFKKKTVTIAVAIISLSPTVINLSSGFMRDLYVIAFLNLSVIALIKKRHLLFLLATFFVMLLRSYMPVVLFPFYVYIYFDKSSIFKRQLFVFVSFLISLFIVSIALIKQGRYYNTSINDILYRFISGILGLNVVVLRLHEIFDQPGVFMIEKLSHIYQFAVMCVLYFIILRSRFRLHSFYIPFLYATVLLSILYGVYLGYFVARTKLVLLWFAIIYIAFHLEKVTQKKAYRKKKTIYKHSGRYNQQLEGKSLELGV